MHKKMNTRLMWLLLLSIEWIYFHLRNSYFIVNNLESVIWFLIDLSTHGMVSILFLIILKLEKNMLYVLKLLKILQKK